MRGKFLARLWEDGETLVVKCGDDERDYRMKADPETCFITDHYRGYPTVLVRLTKVTEADLQEVLEQAWRLHAPRRLVAEYDRRRAARTRSERLKTAVDRAYLAKYHSPGAVKYARDLGRSTSRTTTTELVPLTPDRGGA